MKIFFLWVMLTLSCASLVQGQTGDEGVVWLPDSSGLWIHNQWVLDVGKSMLRKIPYDLSDQKVCFSPYDSSTVVIVKEDRFTITRIDRILSKTVKDKWIKIKNELLYSFCWYEKNKILFYFHAEKFEDIPFVYDVERDIWTAINNPFIKKEYGLTYRLKSNAHGLFAITSAIEGMCRVNINKKISKGNDFIELVDLNVCMHEAPDIYFSTDPVSFFIVTNHDLPKQLKAKRYCFRKKIYCLETANLYSWSETGGFKTIRKRLPLNACPSPNGRYVAWVKENMLFVEAINGNRFQRQKYVLKP